MRAAKGEAVVEEHAAVGNVDGLQVDREALAKLFAERQIESDVRLEMIRGIRRSLIAIGEAGSIVDVGGRVSMPRQRVLAAEVKRVALVMVEEAAAATEGKIGETAVDPAAPERDLIRVGQVNLATVVDARGGQREFPAADARALNGNRDENFGVVEIVVIEKVPGAGEEVVGIDGPTAQGNGKAELVFFVALAVKRYESQVLASG